MKSNPKRQRRTAPMVSMLLMACLLVITVACTGEPPGQPEVEVITTDVTNFWAAYDAIHATEDEQQQIEALHTFFLQPGTPGLAAVMQARNYTADEYLDVIRRHPRFWQSIRPNMSRAGALADEIRDGIQRMQALYPTLEPAPVYFTVGVFRTPGTVNNGLVLIGSELALGDSAVVLEEFAEERDRLESYYAREPIENVAFLN